MGDPGGNRAGRSVPRTNRIIEVRRTMPRPQRIDCTMMEKRCVIVACALVFVSAECWRFGRCLAKRLAVREEREKVLESVLTFDADKQQLAQSVVHGPSGMKS